MIKSRADDDKLNSFSERTKNRCEKERKGRNKYDGLIKRIENGNLAFRGSSVNVWSLVVKNAPLRLGYVRVSWPFLGSTVAISIPL